MSTATSSIDTPNEAATSGPPCCGNMPKPVAQHAWLERFLGDWENETEIDMGPEQGPLKTKSTETARMLGGFWLISQSRGDMPQGGIFENVLTLGYDAGTGKYLGTWVDGMTGYLWKYDGSVNEAGDTLTLDCDGPCPMEPGALKKFREVYSFTDSRHKTFTSSMLGEDGNWHTFLTMKSLRIA